MRVLILAVTCLALAGCATSNLNAYEKQQRREMLERSMAQPSLFSPFKR